MQKLASNLKNYQFWKHNNKPIELWTPQFIKQKICFIHNNAVVEVMVFEQQEYKYKSPIDYCGGIGLRYDICIFEYFEVLICGWIRIDFDIGVAT